MVQITVISTFKICVCVLHESQPFGSKQTLNVLVLLLINDFCNRLPWTEPDPKRISKNDIPWPLNYYPRLLRCHLKFVSISSQLSVLDQYIKPRKWIYNNIFKPWWKKKHFDYGWHFKNVILNFVVYCYIILRLIPVNHRHIRLDSLERVAWILKYWLLLRLGIMSLRFWKISIYLYICLSIYLSIWIPGK